MTNIKWNLNANKSDFMVKAKKSSIAYLDSSFDQFTSSIAIENNQLTNANLEFVLDVNKKEGKFEHFATNLKLREYLNTSEYPFVTFKSISYEKINSDINFVKGYLTINNITKIVELDAKIVALENSKSTAKVLVEILGEINRQDFGLISPSNSGNQVIHTGYNLNLLAHLEFTANSIN